MSSSSCENNSPGTGHIYKAHYTHIVRHPYSLHCAFVCVCDRTALFGCWSV